MKAKVLEKEALEEIEDENRDAVRKFLKQCHLNIQEKERGLERLRIAYRDYLRMEIDDLIIQQHLLGR